MAGARSPARDSINLRAASWPRVQPITFRSASGTPSRSSTQVSSPGGISFAWPGQLLSLVDHLRPSCAAPADSCARAAASWGGAGRVERRTPRTPAH